MKRARLQHGPAEAGAAELAPGSVDLVIADPPYNIGVKGSQWDCIKDYMGFSRAWLEPAVRALREGGALLLYGSPCRDWVARVTLLLVDELGMQYVQDLPWVYTQGSRLLNPVASTHSQTPACLLSGCLHRRRRALERQGVRRAARAPRLV